jgi:hypothetical protein
MKTLINELQNLCQYHLEDTCCEPEEIETLKNAIASRIERTAVKVVCGCDTESGAECFSESPSAVKRYIGDCVEYSTPNAYRISGTTYVETNMAMACEADLTRDAKQDALSVALAELTDSGLTAKDLAAYEADGTV